MKIKNCEQMNKTSWLKPVDSKMQLKNSDISNFLAGRIYLIDVVMILKLLIWITRPVSVK